MLKRIKYLLNHSKLYYEHFNVPVNNCRFRFKDLLIYLKKYQIRKDKEVAGNTVYFVFDPDRQYPGLTDRLKVIVCAYYMAKENGFDFKVIFEHPFVLNDYLKIGLNGSKAATMDELSLSIKNSRLLPFNGQDKIPVLDKRIHQYHIYLCYGQDLLECNNVANWQHVWGENFRELFSPSDALLAAYKSTGLIPKTYICAHLRFVNALEHFEDGFYNEVDEKRKFELIETCLKMLRKIQEENDLPLYVFSDSSVFLSEAKKIGFNVFEGKLGHISYQSDNSTVLKTFTDFYAISQASTVYRIVADGMYNTTFSMYSAFSGDAVFKSISHLQN